MWHHGFGLTRSITMLTVLTDATKNLAQEQTEAIGQQAQNL
jgi:hypothetical protein